MDGGTAGRCQRGYGGAPPLHPARGERQGLLAPEPLAKGFAPFGIPSWGIDNSIEIEKRPATLTAWASLRCYAVLSFYPAAANVTGHWPAAAAIVCGHCPQTGGRKARPYRKNAMLCYPSTRRGDPCGRPSDSQNVSSAIGPKAVLRNHRFRNLAVVRYRMH